MTIQLPDTLSFVMRLTQGGYHLHTSTRLPGVTDTRAIPLVVGTNRIQVQWNGSQLLQLQVRRPGEGLENINILTTSTLGNRRTSRIETIGTDIPGTEVWIQAVPLQSDAPTIQRAVVDVLRSPTPL